uniref:A-kinase anchor protein 7-like phosphoesterase domain-containing protein n=1 Tax=Panagrolaimus sp. JU765 TaxID=591449 RepID=A0AC34Q745_9BILA
MNKLLRYWTLRTKGFKPFGPKIRSFIISKLEKHFVEKKALSFACHKAKQALFEAGSRFQEIYKKRQIVFDGLDQFENSTLFAAPDSDSNTILKILEETVTSAFENRGIRGLNQYKYHPHLTIAELKKTDAELAEKWKNMLGKKPLGFEIIRSLQLCRMKLENKKYYDILAETPV